MEERFCQCCGMPMGETNEYYGMNADGTQNEDYCQYCYDKGAFTADVTMVEMIEECIPHVIEFNPQMSQEDARNMMLEFFPSLKRWSQQA